MPKTRRAQAQQAAQQEEEAQKIEQEQQGEGGGGGERDGDQGGEREAASAQGKQTTQQDAQSQVGDGNGNQDSRSLKDVMNGNRSARDRAVHVSNESTVSNAERNLNPSIHNGKPRNGLEGNDSNELFNQNHNPTSHLHQESEELQLHLPPTQHGPIPTHNHPDLLSPMSAPLFNNNNNHHPLQNHPDFHTSHHDQQQHLQSPGSNQGQNSSPIQSNSHHSFQHPSSQSNHNSNHRQPQTQQFGFLDPFHHNAHLDEANSPDSQHQYRPTSSAGHQHHLGVNHSHPHQIHESLQQSHLPHPGLQYMHRASISGPIPTHGIYPPPNPSFLPHNHGGNAPPHADQMAAWANAAGGARPHTADGMFGHFGAFTGTAWGMGGFDYRGPRASTGSIAGSAASPPPHQRIFSHMSEEDQLQHQHHHQQHPPYPHQHQDRSNSIASGSGAMLGEEEGNHSFESNNDGNQNHQQQHQEGGVPVKKRPRRRYDEIERLYTCGWQGCAKSYGTLNHLNAHVSMQKHGEKRSPTEFKEMRRAWRKGKREEEQRRQQALAKANEEAIVRAKMAAHFDPNLGGGDGGGGSGSNFSIPAGMAPPPPSNTHTVFSPAHAHPHPQGGNMHHPFSVPSHSAHPLPPPPHGHGSMGAPPPQIYQQMNRYSFSGSNGNGNGGEGSPSFNNESDHHQSQNDHNDARPFTSAGQHQHPVAYLLSAHRGSI